MPEPTKAKYHWLTKVSVIGGSAIISAFGSAFLGFLILGGGDDESMVGLILGFPFGFVVGGGIAIWLLGNKYLFGW